VLCDGCHDSAWCSHACRVAREKRHGKKCQKIDFASGRRVPPIDVCVMNPDKALESIVHEMIQRVGPQLYPAPDHSFDMAFFVHDADNRPVMVTDAWCAATTSRKTGVVSFFCNETPDTRLPVGTYSVRAEVGPQDMNQDARRVVRSVGSRLF